MPKLNASDLDQLYIEANSVDEELFSEMRSNILLVSGDHYAKQGSRFWNRIRKNEDLSSTQKLRLTKNHIRNITNFFVTNILTHAPATKVFPNNQDEIQDQKAAELNNSVLQFYKKTLSIREKLRDKAEDLVVFGETWSIIRWDPDIGKVKGYIPYLNDQNQFMTDADGNIVFNTDLPIMEGGFIIERMLPFNVLRPPETQTIEDSEYIIFRKMVKNKILEQMVPEEDRDKIFGNGSEETYMVFNGETGTYSRTKYETMLREHYYRPCKSYPNGYFYIATKNYILFEGELPDGRWPISFKLFDKIPTSPRGRSPIKQMRPYQIEINRAASAIATAQITLGDDKLVLNHGSRMANGGQLPGVRALTVTGSGSDITVIPGRSGEQYVPYMEKQITELYTVMGVAEIDVTNQEGKLDPYALLYQSMRNRRRFTKYTEGFEEFAISESEILLGLAKFYLYEDAVIPIIGRSEIVNIAEFKNSQDNRYAISVEAMDLDAETTLGKQLALNHTLQYVGTQLDKEEIGKIIRAMPYLNTEEAFGELTLDYDDSKNDILALERGQRPPVNKYDNHSYIIKRLVNRIKKPDFATLHPEIQKNFTEKVRAHEYVDAQQKMEILRAQQGLIPTDGYLVVCDFYVTHEDGKTKRIRLPYSSLNWLIQQLKAQGHALEDLEKMSQGALAEMSGMMSQRQQPQQQQQQPTQQARPQEEMLQNPNQVLQTQGVI